VTYQLLGGVGEDACAELIKGAPVQLAAVGLRLADMAKGRMRYKSLDSQTRLDPRYRSSPDEVIPKLEPLAGDFTNFPQHDGRALTLSARSNPSSSRTAPGEPGHLADTVPKLLGNRRADLSRSC
jgi:hypothetical protein